MRLLILGATGRTGQYVTSQAIARGHSVTALVRTASLPPHRNLNSVIGDPRKVEDIATVLAGHDAVISCLGQRKGGDPWLVKEAAEATLAAMERHGVNRYLVLSGALLFRSFNPFVMVMQRMLAGRLADAREMEQIVTASALNWTIVRPPHLKQGDSKAGYEAKAGALPTWLRGLQFADLADCLLNFAESGSYSRQVVGVTSK